MNARDLNATMNRYLREARERGIIGPFRADQYAKARLKGKTPEQAEIIARNKR